MLWGSYNNEKNHRSRIEHFRPNGARPVCLFLRLVLIFKVKLFAFYFVCRISRIWWDLLFVIKTWLTISHQIVSHVSAFDWHIYFSPWLVLNIQSRSRTFRLWISRYRWQRSSVTIATILKVMDQLLISTLTLAVGPF